MTETYAPTAPVGDPLAADPGPVGEAPIDGESGSAANTLRTARLRPFRWREGQSGNPTGRPRVDREARDLARKHGPAAIRRLAELMRSKNERVAVAACQVLLDRGYGKPVTPITNADGSPLLRTLINFESPIIDAATAAQLYAALIGGRAAIDTASITFKPPSPPLPEPAPIETTQSPNVESGEQVHE